MSRGEISDAQIEACRPFSEGPGSRPTMEGGPHAPTFPAPRQGARCSYVIGR